MNHGGTPNDFSVMFGDSNLMSLLNTPGEPYTVYTFDVVATSSSTALGVSCATGSVILGVG